MMLRAKSTTPPTRAWQSSCSSSALSSASAPVNPTRRSCPRAGDSSATRTGSAGTNVRQLLAAIRAASSRTAKRRWAALAATGYGDQSPHAFGVHRLSHVAVALDERADDDPVGDRQELRHGVGGDAAADQQRDGGDDAPHALDVGDGRGLAGGLARDDPPVGQAAVNEIARLRLQLGGGPADGRLSLALGGEPGGG